MRSMHRLPALAFATCFAVGFLTWEGPTTGYWDTYIAAPAMHLVGDSLDFRLNDGRPAYDVRLTGELPDDLVDHRPEGFGIISEDQRLGAALVAAPFFDGFGLIGFRLVHALLLGLSAAITVLALGAAGLSGGVALVGSLVAHLNPYSLTVNRLNANIFALPALATLLWIALRQRAGGPDRDDVKPLVLGGLLLGVLGGIRNECILVLPALAWPVLAGRPARDWPKPLAAVVLPALVTLAPTLAWQRIAFGEFVVHASQYASFEGWRPTFPHGLGPWRFDFNGMLNWPFHDALVRTPHFPYPTMVLLPLVAVRSLGVLGAALFLVGSVSGFRRDRASTIAAALWIGLMWAMLSVQENWEELKMTYLVLLAPPLALVLAEGLGFLSRGAVSFRRRSLSYLAAALLVAGAVMLLGRVRVPPDPRWPVRFPHAATNAAGFEVLPPEKRWAWEFFHSAETAVELDRERARLLPPPLLPSSWRSPLVEGNGRTIASELGQRSIRTLAIWKYIYTPPAGIVPGTAPQPPTLPPNHP